MASNNDLIGGIDPTAYPTITGADLLALINSGTPYTDKGLTILTTDDGSGNPDVPNAVGTTKWQRYIWIRQSATSTGVYVWNANAASDATYLKWQSIIVAGIGVGTIVNNMIADNTIQDAKIVGLSYSKLSGAPSGISPTGAAGGDLTGSTYPNPVIANGAISTAKIADANVTNSKLEAGVSGVSGIDLTSKVNVPAIGLVIPRVNAGHTAIEYVTAATIVNAVTTANMYVSADTAMVVANGTTELVINNAAHGLTLSTKMVVTTYLIAGATAELGYTTGDAAIASPNILVTVVDATYVNVRRVASPASIIHKTTGVTTAIDTSKWKVRTVITLQ